MPQSNIQQIFQYGWNSYCNSFQPSSVQSKTANAILNCKSGELGYNVSICEDCGHTEMHANSCRNRNCPNCQAILKELWIDSRKAEVIDTPYFHVVFTIPSELNPLIYSNPELLYSLLHKCSSETLLSLSKDKKYLGATPGIIQVLHTWGQELNYHPHIHCIISGGGLTIDHKIKKSSSSFFIPVRALGKVFRGKFLEYLQKYKLAGKLHFADSIQNMRNSYEWNEFRNALYLKDWCPYIKETFNGFGNAIDYLGRYAHRIAISNSRILSVDDNRTIFSAKDYRTSEKKEVAVTNKEFIRRFMMHVLPSGFQKIRYYGFLNNRSKAENLKLIFKLQGFQKFKSLYSGLPMDKLLKAIWDVDIHICHACGCNHMRYAGKSYVMRN